MRTIHSTAVAISAFVLVYSQQNASAQIDTDCRRQLDDQALPEWRSLLSEFSNLSVEITRNRVMMVGDDETEKHRTFHYCSTGQDGFHWMEMRPLGDDRQQWQSLYIGNPEYRFTARRVESSASYLLHNVTDRSTVNVDESLKPLERAIRSLASAGINVWGVRLEDILLDPAFEMITCTTADEAAPRRVTVESRYNGSARRGHWHPGARYWAVLDPDLRWCIVECGVDIPDTKHHYTVSLAYQESERFGVYPESLVAKEYTEGESSFVEDQVAFGEPTGCTRPSEQFYLAHYGIPESAAEAPIPRNWLRLVLFNLGLLGTAAGIWLFLRSHRQSAPDGRN